MDSYRSDLAYIYDAGFSGFALCAASGLMHSLRRSGIHGGRAVELGCGNGILARQLGFAGYEVIGVDVSPAMVRLARVRAPRAGFFVSSVQDFDLPDCDAVLAIGQSCSYAFAGDPSGSELLGFFHRVHGALRPGGVMILDFAQFGRCPGGMPKKGHWKGDGWALMLEAEQDTAQRLITRHFATSRRIGKLHRTGEETHILRVFDQNWLTSALERTGFAVRALGGYGGLRFKKGHAGLYARKLTP